MLTTQKLTGYYERFKGAEVTFTRELIQITGLHTGQVCVKCGQDLLPAVIYASSFERARLLLNLKSGVVKKLAKANSLASVRFCFANPDGGDPLTFFVPAKSMGYTPYGKTEDMALFTFQFSQRPPDGLIEILGRIEDTNVNAERRRDERIALTPDSMRRLQLGSRETDVLIQEVPRRCVVRDISFGGAQIIMTGVAKFLVGKDAALRLDFTDPVESFTIKGRFTSGDTVGDRKGLVIVAFLFEETAIPMRYKLRLNDYLSNVRPDAPAPTPAPAAPAAPPAPAAQ